MASDPPEHTEEDYDTVATLTRSTEDGYSRFSDAYTDQERRYIEDLFSGSFDDPGSVLDNHQALPDSDTIGRRPPMPLPNQVGQSASGVATEYIIPQAQQLVPDIILPYSDSDDDYDEVEVPIVSEPNSRVRSESDVIDIMGSLCLEGVFQGLSEDNHAHQSSMLPSSIRMTDNLVERGEELDELSVMVTRNLEIVPENPFDANTGTGKSGRGVLKTKGHRHSVPKLRLRARSEVPERPSSVSLGKVDHRPTSVTYFDNIIRPQPLPPLDENLSKEEKKRYKIMESLLESEAAFLTSINIAIESYKKPLMIKAQESNTVLETDKIQLLFGPIKLIQDHHELFYAAISEETKDWSPSTQIGGVFLASFGKKEVVRHYSRYVNNFSKAMDTLTSNIKKKKRFLDFLKKQLIQSGTQLSLQALLLKPVQRFPQYLLFLQDLIKYTPPDHEDSIKLQMAQAQMERIAEFLNEAKRCAEQLVIVQYISSKIHKAPFKLADMNKYLLRQDSVQWVGKRKDGVYKVKRRELLMFDKMLVCCANQKRKIQVAGDDLNLEFKWFCPLSKLEVIEPDYVKEDRLQTLVSNVDESNTLANAMAFEALQKELHEFDSDFQKLCKIQAIVASLYGQYQGITTEVILNNIRVIQRKLERVRDQLRNCEPCRLDITIPARDAANKARYRHIIVFSSETYKKDWLRSMHFAGLRLSQYNKQTWIAEDEDDEFDATDDESAEEGGSSAPAVCSDVPDPTMHSSRLPLVANQIKLIGSKNECTSVECATCVGSNRVWFSCSGMESAQIAVVRCLMPTPLLLETFTVDCKRVLCMKAIPTSRSQGETNVNASPSSSLNVWLGSSCGKLMLCDAVKGTVLNMIQLQDAVLCIECFKNRAFVGLANGKVEVYTRVKGGEWDLTRQKHHIPVAECPIQTFCPVDNELWIGVENMCVILNMESLKLEHSIKLSTEPGISVKRMARSNNGVWLSLNRGGTLTLYHKNTRRPIQEIDVKGSIMNIVECASLNAERNFSNIDSVYVSSLLVSSGYLWVGTSHGALLVYRIPYSHGLPVTTGKPLLAGDGHTDAIRVLLDVHTLLDLPTARFDQFVSEEKARRIGSFHVTPTSSPKHQRGLEEVAAKENGQQQDKEASTKLTVEDQQKTELSCSVKIDKSALPIVSDMIKRLEKTKKIGGFSPLLTARQKRRKPPGRPPVVSPKPKKKQNPPPNEQATNHELTDLSADAPPTTLKDGKSDQQPISDDTENTMVTTTDPVVQETTPSQQSTTASTENDQEATGASKDYTSSPAIQIHAVENNYEAPIDGKVGTPSLDDTPNDYETPVHDTTYDSVPTEDEEDGHDTNGDGVTGLESTSDPDISLQRYEGEASISLGEGLYDNLRTSTLSINIPGHKNVFFSKEDEGHVFILTGGRGSVDFRQTTADGSTNSKQILSHCNLDVAASSIAFQVPK